VDVWNLVSAGFAKGVYEEEPYREYFPLNDYEIDGEEVRAAFLKMVYRF
jgi:hypothetical protein